MPVPYSVLLDHLQAGSRSTVYPPGASLRLREWPCICPRRVLKGLSDTVATEAVRIACQMVLPLWETWALHEEHPLKDLPERALSRMLPEQTDRMMSSLFEGDHAGNMMPHGRVWHAVSWWYAWDSGYSSVSCRHCLISSLSAVREASGRAPGFMGRWRSRVKAVFAFKDAATAVLEK